MRKESRYEYTFESDGLPVTDKLPEYKCEKHGDIGDAILFMGINKERYGKRICAKCYWDFASQHCCEAKEIEE